MLPATEAYSLDMLESATQEPHKFLAWYVEEPQNDHPHLSDSRCVAQL